MLYAFLSYDTRVITKSVSQHDKLVKFLGMLYKCKHIRSIHCDFTRKIRLVYFLSVWISLLHLQSIDLKKSQYQIKNSSSIRNLISHIYFFFIKKDIS